VAAGLDQRKPAQGAGGVALTASGGLAIMGETEENS
jgi:hypothetical protein